MHDCMIVCPWDRTSEKTKQLTKFEYDCRRSANERCTEQMPRVSGTDGCDQLVDDGGVATLMMHKGTELEVAFNKDGTLPDPESTANSSAQVRLCSL